MKAAIYKTMKLTDLIPADYNPRKDLQPGDKEWEKISDSLQNFGLVEPLVYNERSGHIVGGHQRAKILAYQGRTEATVSVVDLDDDAEKILATKLNRVQGFWDSRKLAELLTEIKQATGSIAETGFEDWEYESMTQEYDHIENLLEDDFSDAGKSESDTFAITFTFPMEAKEKIDGFIFDEGKDALRDIIIKYIRRGEK